MEIRNPDDYDDWRREERRAAMRRRVQWLLKDGDYAKAAEVEGELHKLDSEVYKEPISCARVGGKWRRQ